MTRYVVLLAALAAGGCLADPAELAALEQYAGNQEGKCPAHICGLNSPDLDDGWFYELNLDGAVNRDGFMLVSTTKSGAGYRLSTANGRLWANRISGNPFAPATLASTGLVGTQLRIRKTTGTFYNVEIEQVSAIVNYRATLPNGSTPRAIESYRFRIKTDPLPGSGLVLSTLMCQNGDLFVDLRGHTAMPAHHAVLFEGERIDVDSMTISPASERWVNIGCAETALAKLQLAGHTKASQVAGFSTSSAERQTMLKLLVGDYCGTGYPITVAGQPLEWTDDRNTLHISAGVSTVLEARWGPDGAICLNKPRLVAHPSAASEAAFPAGVTAAIRAACNGAVPPPCQPTLGVVHLKSYNITGFTN